MKLKSIHYKSSDIISGLALLVAVISVYYSYSFSKRSKDFNESTFLKTYYRDSVLNFKEDSLVDKQLMYINEQTMIQGLQFKYDSLFSKKQLDVLNKEYNLKIQFEKIRKGSELVKLLAITSSCKSKRKYINLNPSDSSDLIEIEDMIGQITQELPTGRLNEYYVLNKKIRVAWEELIQSSLTLRVIMVNKGRKGAGILNTEKIFNAAFESAYDEMLKKIGVAEKEIKLAGKELNLEL